MVGIIQIEEFHSGVPRRFLISVVFVLDHFSADPAITPINATGHQLVSLCRLCVLRSGRKFLSRF